MSAPTAERLAKIREAVAWDGDVGYNERDLLAALDHVAARLAEHEATRPQASYGVHRELIAYIGGADGAR